MSQMGNKIWQQVKKNVVVVAIFFLIPLWMFFLEPAILKIPSNFSYSADVISVDNFYDETSGAYRGEQYSKTNFFYKTIASKGNILSIQNTFNVQSLDGKQIFKTEPVYSINALTGEHVRGVGDKDRQGYLFAPRGLKRGQSYQYWHVSGTKPLDMQFVDEETIYGLKVYKYQSADTGEMDMTEFFGFLPGVPETRGVKLKGALTQWIEPVSGYLVKIEDYSTDYYFYDIVSKQRLSPYNQFMNTYSESTVQQKAITAKDEKLKVLFVMYGVPSILGLFLLLVLLLRLPYLQALKKKLSEDRVGYLILIISLLATFFTYNQVNRNLADQQKNSFETQSNVIRDQLEKRIDDYKGLLQGTRGLFDASQYLSRDEWGSYLNSVSLPTNYPGVLSLGLAQDVAASEKEAFVNSVRTTDLPDFSIYPQVERSVYTPILYLEPLSDRNKKILGYDLSSDSTRRQALAQARDTGLIVATNKLTSINEAQEDSRAGFLLYLALYKDHQTPETSALRQSDIFGYVFAAIRMDDFMKQVVKLQGTDLEFHIYDGLRVTADSQIYDFLNEDASGHDVKDILFRKIETIYIAGHPWTIEYINSANYKRGIVDELVPWAVLGIGSIMSLLLFIVYSGLAASKKRAINYAKTIKQELEQNVELQKRNVSLQVKAKQETENLLIEISKRNENLENSKKATLNLLEDIQAEKEKYESVSNKLVIATGSANIGIIEIDLKSLIISADETTSLLYGRTKGPFEMPFTAWQSVLHPEDATRVVKNIQSAFKNKTNFEDIFRIIWPNGATRYIKASAQLEYDANQKPVKMVGVNIDVTRDKEIDQAKTEFVSLASHQLRTPLSTIGWYSEMLLSEDVGKLNADQKSYLQEVYKGNQRMVGLVNALLNVSRIDLGTFAVDPKPTDLKEIAEIHIKEIEPQIMRKSIILQKNFAADLPIINADPKLMGIIFQNLLSNAVKYTAEKGSVTCSLEMKRKNILIAVADTGYGIPLDQQDKIFTKLFRADNVRQKETEGTGLGLYIVKAIVEQSGGKVWFESIENKGTTFYVSLPLTGMKTKEGNKELT